MSVLREDGMSCTCRDLVPAQLCPECRKQELEGPHKKKFMPGCTCPGVQKGTACPLCGNVK